MKLESVLFVSGISLTRAQLGFPAIRSGTSLPAEAKTSIVVALRGDPGPPGTSYRHTQSAPEGAWYVNHNLGYNPNVGVFSPGGASVWAEVVHLSENQIIVYFDEPFSGFVVCS